MSVDNKARMKQRSMEIGRVLKNARTSKNVSITECATLIGTGRPRYRDIESGESPITVVELELLMELLEIPREETAPKDVRDWGRGRKVHRIPVAISPEETIYLVVDIAQHKD